MVEHRRTLALISSLAAWGCASSPPITPAEVPTPIVAPSVTHVTPPAEPEPSREALCRRGDTEACNALPRESDVDPERVRTLLREACAAHPAAGCSALLGISQRASLGADRALALAALETACATSNEACAALAEARLDASSFARDVRAAMAALDTACARDSADACADLASFYFAGGRTEHDPVRAIALAERACTLDPQGGCVVLGTYLLDPLAPVPYDLARGAALLTTHCRERREGCAALYQAVRARRATAVTAAQVLEWATAGLSEEAAREKRAELVGGDAREGTCASPLPRPDDERALAAFVASQRARLRTPGVLPIARTPEAVRRTLTTMLDQFMCGFAARNFPRWLRAMRATGDGLDMLVEWASELEGSYALHISIVHLDFRGGRMVQDSSNFWMYVSMGLEGWWRDARSDLDLDGIPDVLLSVWSGFDDAGVTSLMYVSSKNARLDVIDLVSTQSGSANGCFVADAAGPTFIALLHDRPEAADDPSATCMSAARFDATRGVVRAPLSMDVGEPIAIMETERTPLHATLAARARDAGRNLAGVMPPLRTSRTTPALLRSSYDEDRDAPEALLDARLFTRDSPYALFGVCPGRPTFPLVITDEETFEPDAVRFATPSSRTEPNARIVAPEVERVTRCDTFP
jgi:hypothetical protein